MSAADRIYDLPWYQLSPHQQFMMQVIIMRAQTPFEVRALGVFICSLEVYLKVQVFHLFIANVREKRFDRGYNSKFQSFWQFFNIF